MDWPNIVGQVTFEEILRVHKNCENKTMINNNFYLIFHSPIIREKVLFYALHEWSGNMVSKIHRWHFTQGNFPLKSGYLWHQHWIWERIVGARWLWYITVLGNWWWQWSWWLGGSSFRRSSWTGRWRRPCQESESEILKLGSNTDAALAFLPLDWWWWSCWCQRCFQFFYIEVELSPWGR